MTSNPINVTTNNLNQANGNQTTITHKFFKQRGNLEDILLDKSLTKEQFLEKLKLMKLNSGDEKFKKSSKKPKLEGN